MIRNSLFCLLFIVFGQSSAQVNEFGLFVGSSGYYGDIGHDRAESVLAYQNKAVGFVYKRNVHDYLSLRASIKLGTVDADDVNSNYKYRQDRNLSFKSDILDFSLGFEFNFAKYIIRKRKTIKSPYLFAGISLVSFNPKAQNRVGEWIDLQPLATEGQGSAVNPNSKYSLNSITIPFGLGYKINIGTKLAIGIEWVWHATNTDYIDDVSAYYVSEDYLSEEAIEMANKSETNVVVGKTRGNPNNNDWYNFTGITISYKIKNRPKKCPKALLP